MTAPGLVRRASASRSASAAAFRAVVVCGLVGGALAGRASAAPVFVTHQGRILDPLGQPLNEPMALTFRLLDPSGVERYAQTTTVAIQDGYYSVALGAVDAAWFADPLSVVVEADGQVVGQQSLTAVPYALSVDGVVRVSAAPGDCAGREGLLRYQPGVGLEVCDGIAFQATGFDRHRPILLPTRGDYASNVVITRNGQTVLVWEADRLRSYSAFGPDLPYLEAGVFLKSEGSGRLVRTVDLGGVEGVLSFGRNGIYLYNPDGSGEESVGISGHVPPYYLVSAVGFDEVRQLVWVLSGQEFYRYHLAGSELQPVDSLMVPDLPSATYHGMAFSWSTDSYAPVRTALLAVSSGNFLAGFVIFDADSGEIVRVTSSGNGQYLAGVIPFPGRSGEFGLASPVRRAGASAPVPLIEFFGF